MAGDRTKLRLAVVCRTETANGWYRAILPLLDLERRGHTVLWPGHSSYDVLDAGGVPQWDLVHMQQYVAPNALETITRLRDRGVAVVWDTDDDIAGVPRGSSSYQKLGGRRKVRRLFDYTVELARAAHLLTTTNEHLAQIYRDAGVEHVEVLGNFLAPADVGRPRPRHQGVVIGVVAAAEHGPDLERLGIAQVLERLLATHEGVRVVAVGLDLKLRDPRYQHHARVPIRSLLDVVRGFDIGLAPLVDSRMTRSRSDVKLKEYAAAGAVWLASPVGPYVGLGEAQGGLLVEDEGWYSALDRLLADVTWRASLAKRGTTWARQQTVVQVGETRERVLQRVRARSRHESARSAASGSLAGQHASRFSR